MSNCCGCPQLERTDWDLKKHSWNKRAFYRTSHHLIFHVPIGIAGAIRRGVDGIQAAQYTFNAPHMMLDDEPARSRRTC